MALFDKLLGKTWGSENSEKHEKHRKTRGVPKSDQKSPKTSKTTIFDIFVIFRTLSRSISAKWPVLTGRFWPFLAKWGFRQIGIVAHGLYPKEAWWTCPGWLTTRDDRTASTGWWWGTRVMGVVVHGAVSRWYPVVWVRALYFPVLQCFWLKPLFFG